MNKQNEFIEEVFEIAFGNNAINKNYSYNEVLKQLMQFSNNAFKYEKLLDNNKMEKKQ
tara:strand:+ start:1931 stop:2104 length:174 start_codon:yes stop_codon:yes gene_type:complete